MPRSLPARGLLGALAAVCFCAPCPAAPPQTQSQAPTQPPQPSGSQTPPTKPAALKQAQPSQTKKPTVGPTAPQSTHYPILLLATGRIQTASDPLNLVPASASDPTWSLRIGQKGPERLDRTNYPPIPLEPAEVTREGASDSWTYRAKDSQTGAAVSVRITRESCVDISAPATQPAPTAAAPVSTEAAKPAVKFGFTATVEHAQLGSMQGCARVAAELFPKIKNQLNEDDDEDDQAKDKPPPPTVTHFKNPVYVAYITGTDKMIVKRGAVARSVPGKPGYSLCLSHDGKKLLFTRDETPSPLRTINEYDFETGKVKELIRANAYQAFWSPDDSRIAFLKNTDNKWQVWTMPAAAPEQATLLSPVETVTLHGWADAHTIIAGDLQTLFWLGDDGGLKQTLSSQDLYGKDQFRLSSANTVRIHPLNADLLLVSAELAPAASAASRSAPPTASQSLFLFEIRSKRRVLLTPSDLNASEAEWSRDGLQIFFAGRPLSLNAMSLYKMFWDGTSQTKTQDGHEFVVGQ